MGLFVRMTRSEQVHSLNVLRDVLAQDDDTPIDLAVAGLLHDVGKLRYPLDVFQRTFAVVLTRLAPKLEQRYSIPAKMTYWRAPLIVRRHHPRWSAELLKANGGSERAVWLVEHHADNLAALQGHLYFTLLARLKQADDAN